MFFEQYENEPCGADGAGHDRFAGARYSVADIALCAYTHAAGEGSFGLARYPGIGTWLKRVAAQPN
jgi:glutathione S-transferase